MNKDELRQILSECCNDISFFYKGLASGVTFQRIKRGMVMIRKSMIM